MADVGTQALRGVRVQPCAVAYHPGCAVCVAETAEQPHVASEALWKLPNRPWMLPRAHGHGPSGCCVACYFFARWDKNEWWRSANLKPQHQAEDGSGEATFHSTLLVSRLLNLMLPGFQRTLIISKKTFLFSVEDSLWGFSFHHSLPLISYFFPILLIFTVRKMDSVRVKIEKSAARIRVFGTTVGILSAWVYLWWECG